MEEAYAKSKNLQFNKEQWMTEEWAAIKKEGFTTDTGFELNKLKKIGLEITKLPENGGGTFHPQIVKIFKAREKSIQDG